MNSGSVLSILLLATISWGGAKVTSANERSVGQQLTDLNGARQ